MAGSRYERSDLALVRAAQRGDATAQRELARRLLPIFRRVARSFVRCPADVEDIIQQAAVACLRSLPSFEGRAELERWAQRVATRHALDYVRKERRRASRRTESDGAEEMAVDPDPSMRRFDTTPRPVEDYLRQLSDEQRTVLMMRYVLGYTLKEVAELTGESSETLKSRLVVARRRVRAMIRRDRAFGVRVRKPS